MMLGGFSLKISGDREQLSPLFNPDKKEMLLFLQQVQNRNGIIRMKNLALKKNTPENLSLYLDSNRYMLFLTYNDEEDQEEFRTLHNDSKTQALEIMLGEPFPSETITEDFNLIIDVFKEFHATGNVSDKLLY